MFEMFGFIDFKLLFISFLDPLMSFSSLLLFRLILFWLLVLIYFFRVIKIDSSLFFC